MCLCLTDNHTTGNGEKWPQPLYNRVEAIFVKTIATYFSLVGDGKNMDQNTFDDQFQQEQLVLLVP